MIIKVKKVNGIKEIKVLKDFKGLVVSVQKVLKVKPQDLEIKEKKE